ncbi:MAG: phosphotransferase family protein [Sphingomonadaceae bacterium]|nr:phosphotransferase family protein [Sphingomonadaceae bacterium]
MSENAPARADIDFEPAKLRAFLADAVPQASGPLKLQRIGGGQSNPTYFVDTAGERMVLRKRPPGEHVRGAHDVGREYRILSALYGTPVPVPKPILYREETDVVGTPFYLMGCVAGRVFDDAALPEVPKEQRRAYYLEFSRVLAALHAVDVDTVGLGSFRRPDRYLVRQLSIWTRQWGDLVETDRDVARVVGWLRDHLPEDEESAIVHGDYKINNVIYAPEGPGLAAVIDWELCTVGDPLVDLAHVWSFMWETTLDEYGGMMGKDFAALGLPTAVEFFDDYYAHAQSDRRLTPYHFVFAHFRNAGIFHGIAQRAAAGSANAGNAAEKGKLDRVYLGRALAAIDRFG